MKEKRFSRDYIQDVLIRMVHHSSGLEENTIMKKFENKFIQQIHLEDQS